MIIQGILVNVTPKLSLLFNQRTHLFANLLGSSIAKDGSKIAESISCTKFPST